MSTTKNPEISDRYVKSIKLLISHPDIWKVHSSGTLINHLIETREILVRWKIDEETEIAGLLHSIYGTSEGVFTLFNENDRGVVAGITGESIEEIIWLYSKLDIDDILASLESDRNNRTMSALLHIEIANFLEQQHRQPTLINENNVQALEDCIKHLAAGAVNDLRQFLIK